MLALHSMVEYPLWYGPFQVALGLSIWLLARPLAWSANTVTRSRAGVTAVLLLATAYASWDYYRVSQIYLAPEDRAASYRADALQQVRGSWLFQNQVRFAELTTTPLTLANAAHLNTLALALLHFSPEPRVVEKLIESATLLKRNEQALHYLARYRAAFADEHQRWARDVKNTQ